MPALCPGVFSTPALSEVAIQQVYWAARRAAGYIWVEHRAVHRAEAFSDSLSFHHGPANRLLLEEPHVEFFENRDRERGGTLRDWYVAACQSSPARIPPAVFQA